MTTFEEREIAQLRQALLEADERYADLLARHIELQRCAMPLSSKLAMR